MSEMATLERTVRALDRALCRCSEKLVLGEGVGSGR
jgi:hypothetical protein